MHSTLVFLIATGVIVFTATSVEGCHVTPNNRRSLYHHKSSIADFFSTCLTEKTGKPYRWEAIAKFAIEDTTWYDVSGSKYCGSGRDTDECWMNQTDFLIAKSSPYSYFVKRCIQEYTAKESEFMPKFEYDNTALQGESTTQNSFYNGGIFTITTTTTTTTTSTGLEYYYYFDERYSEEDYEYLYDYVDDQHTSLPPTEPTIQQIYDYGTSEPTQADPTNGNSRAKRSGRAKRAIDSSNMLLLWLTQQWARSGQLAQNTTRNPSSTTRRTLFNPLRPTTKVQPRPSTTHVADPERFIPWNAPIPNPNPFQYPIPATAPTQAPTNLPPTTPYPFTQPPHGPYNNQGNQQETQYPVPPNNFQSLPNWMRPPQNMPGVPPTPNPFSFTSTQYSHPHGGWIPQQHIPSTAPPPPFPNTPNGNPHNFNQQFPGQHPQPSNHFPYQPYPTVHPPLPHQPGHASPSPTTASSPLDLSNVDFSQLSQHDIALLQLLQGNGVLTTTTTTTTPPIIPQGGMPDSQFQQLINLLKLKMDNEDLYQEENGDRHPTTEPPSTGLMCDGESQARFVSCVKTKMSIPTESTRRMLSPFQKVLTLQDVVSIVAFFQENHSTCTSVDLWDPKQGGIVRQCSPESMSRTGPLSCLTNFMLQIVKSGSSLQRTFSTCA